MPLLTLCLEHYASLILVWRRRRREEMVLVQGRPESKLVFHVGGVGAQPERGDPDLAAPAPEGARGVAAAGSRATTRARAPSPSRRGADGARQVHGRALQPPHLRDGPQELLWARARSRPGRERGARRRTLSCFRARPSRRAVARSDDADAQIASARPPAAPSPSRRSVARAAVSLSAHEPCAWPHGVHDILHAERDARAPRALRHLHRAQRRHLDQGHVEGRATRARAPARAGSSRSRGGGRAGSETFAACSHEEATMLPSERAACSPRPRRPGASALARARRACRVSGGPRGPCGYVKGRVARSAARPPRSTPSRASTWVMRG